MSPAVMDWRDGQVVDERVAILLVVQQLNNAGLACMVSMIGDRQTQSCRLNSLPKTTVTALLMMMIMMCVTSQQCANPVWVANFSKHSPCCVL